MKEEPFTVFENGQQIIGIVHIPEKKSRITIVLLHGWNSNKLGANGIFVRAAREFCKNGFKVIRFDFRGSGDSEGEFKKQTFDTMFKDIKAVIGEEENICIVGHSLGGDLAIASNKLGNIISICTWAAPARHTETLSKALIEEVEEKGEVYYKELGVSINKDQIHSCLKRDFPGMLEKIKIPCLFVNGSEDIAVPPSQAKKLYNHSKGRKKIVIIEGVGHLFLGKEEELIELTLKWFKNKRKGKN